MVWQSFTITNRLHRGWWGKRFELNALSRAPIDGRARTEEDLVFALRDGVDVVGEVASLLVGGVDFQCVDCLVCPAWIDDAG